MFNEDFKGLDGIVRLGMALHQLCTIHSEWSRETFGSDADRGPIGPLKHLEREAKEAYENPTDRSEYADCLLLLLDASRRAGLSPLELILEAQRKMVINKARIWSKPIDNQPVEHVE